MHWLYLFRHGETDFNREYRFQGHLDTPLNDEGRRQAAGLVEPLRRMGIECILSSDLIRARETAQIIAKALEVEVFETPGLREAHLGDAQGLTVEEIEERFGKGLVQKWKSPYLSDADVSYPGGETGREVLERVLASVSCFVGGTRHRHIGIATHGGVIRRVVRSLLTDTSLFIPIPNGIIYPVMRDPSTGRLELAVTSPLRRNG